MSSQYFSKIGTWSSSTTCFDFWSFWSYVSQTCSLSYKYQKCLVLGKFSESFFFWLCLSKVFINYSTWYSLYSIPRTLINVSEATLFLVAFYFWKKAFDENNLYSIDWKSILTFTFRKLETISRFFIAINFCMRPTSIAIWAPIWVFSLLIVKLISIISWFKVFQTLTSKDSSDFVSNVSSIGK